MIRVVARVLVVLGIVEAVLIAVFRTRWEPALRAVRHFNRRVLNPLMLRMAGRPRFYASVVHHVGRATGRGYNTPVTLERLNGALVIPLPYGPEVDWCRNVLAAGGCRISSKGLDILVSQPEVVPAAQVRPYLSASGRRTIDVYGIGHYLHLAPVANVESPRSATAGG